jgi:hypothetical protein
MTVERSEDGMGTHDDGARVPTMAEICELFAEQPHGTVVRFTRGEDFTVRPVTFRNNLHRTMRSLGYRIETAPDRESVLARISGPVGGGEDR